jgi:plasmid stability protein
MTTQSVRIELPETIYQQLQERAQQTQRTIQETARDVLVDAVEHGDALPSDLEAALASLVHLSDDELWRAARTRMPTEAASQLETLNRKRQRTGLGPDETQTATALLQLYERTMLIRAQAAALLKARGHAISSLLDAA